MKKTKIDKLVDSAKKKAIKILEKEYEKIEKEISAQKKEGYDVQHLFDKQSWLVFFIGGLKSEIQEDIARKGTDIIVRAALTIECEK